jgi:hypothetical protein
MNEVTTTKKANVREILETPFPPETIKTRPASFGGSLSYVEAHEYIRRLNQAFDGNWSFEIVKHEIGENEVIVVGKLVADGIVKMAFGGSDIKRKKETGEIICIADDLKAAATDAMKKASSFLGIGLHLYAGTDTAASNGKPANGNGNAKPADAAPANGNGANEAPATSKQLHYAKTLADDRGMTLESLKAMARTRYGCALDAITRRQASALIEDLKFA